MLTEYRDLYAIISNAKNAPIVILNQESMHQSNWKPLTPGKTICNIDMKEEIVGRIVALVKYQKKGIV